MSDCKDDKCCCDADPAQNQAILHNGGNNGGHKLSLRIDNMDCPTEEALIRSRLSKMPGVDSLSFDLIERKLTVGHSLDSPDAIEAALASIGMDSVRMEEAVRVPMKESSRKLAVLAIGGTFATAAEIAAWISGRETSWPVIAFALAAIMVSGFQTYKKGLIALRNLNLNMNALMSFAVTGAVLIGQWPEAAMVIVLFSLAEVIESRSMDRARNAIHSLMALSPDRANVKQPDGSWEEIEAKGVAIGSVVRIRPGERIPLDGEIISGHTSINQATITGESMPVAKNSGDKVFAGTINETGSFDYRTTAEAGNSTLARIIKTVEEAQESRAPTQRFVDRFSKIYTPVVFILAVIVAVVPPLTMGYPWMDWIYRALVLLVIACPCALVISTPVTVVSGLASAAREGILIKGGAYLEAGRKIRSMAFDKTGTITHGKPVVTDMVPLSGDVDKGLRLAAALAVRSDHPVSAAVIAHWKENYGGIALEALDSFKAVPGRGIMGRIGGKNYYLGNHRYVEELGICSPDTERELERLENQGKSTVVICSESSPLLIIGVADTVRETSGRAIAGLKSMGVHTLMLTGDNPLTAGIIGAKVGIDEIRSNLLPEDKLSAIKDELARYGAVGMVGDGINDAPALAQSSIGFAMGAAGSDTALETADVALMDDDLRKIPQFIRLSIRTGAVLKENITIALGIKAVFFVLALTGKATLWMAVFADMGASLIVIFNGLRLLKSLPVPYTENVYDSNQPIVRPNE